MRQGGQVGHDLSLKNIDTAVAALAGGRNRDPFAVLGPHPEGDAIVIRAFHPAARSMALRLFPEEAMLPMTRRGATAAFEIALAATPPR